MSGIKNTVETFISGEPGTTGREPFEDTNVQLDRVGGGYTGESGFGSHHHHQGEGGLATATGVAGLGGSGRHEGSGLTGHHEGSGLTGRHEGSGLTGTHGQHSHSLTGDNNVGAGRIGQSGNTGIEEAAHRHHDSQHHSGTGGGLSGLAAKAGLSSSGTVPAAERGGDGGHSHYAQDDGPAGTHSRNQDRVGALGQGSSEYDRTGPGGVTTGGAAGTDRFDTDKPRVGEDRLNTDNHKPHAQTGGLAGMLNTTDKEFVDRDRTGPVSGAYADEGGAFRGNTSGPGGNTALTGREGNHATNPVSQAKDAVAGSHTGTNHPGVAHGTTGTTGTTGTHGTTGTAGHNEPAHHKGIVEKIKDAIL